MKHDQHIKRAIMLAKENVQNGSGGPFGAVIVKDGQIIGEGKNSVTTLNDPTAHAEIMAIRDACQKLGTFHLEDCTIYSSCEPCPMCLSSIYWAHITDVHYAATKNDAGKAGFIDKQIYDELQKAQGLRILHTTHHPSDAAIEVFELWKGAANKVEY